MRPWNETCRKVVCCTLYGKKKEQWEAVLNGALPRETESWLGGPAVLDRRRQDSAAKLGPSRLPLRESQADHLRTTGSPSCSLLLVIFQTSYCVIFDMCRGIDDTFVYVVKHKHLRNPASAQFFPLWFLCQ